MTERMWFLLIISGAALWRLGGWKRKSWRRFVWPALFAMVGYCIGFHIKPLLLVAVLSHLSYRLPDGVDEGKRVHLYYGLIVAALLPLGCSWWQLITWVGFSATLLLSNWRWTRYLFPWVVCECIRGAALGQTIADLYSRGGW